MFSERFDALMRVSEVSNSLLGREINMNSSHIGRLRSGARPLPKRHEFLQPICRYLVTRITQDYQLTALKKLTNIDDACLEMHDAAAEFLEQWLVANDSNVYAATGRLISGYSRLASGKPLLRDSGFEVEASPRFSEYLYGNAGKRKAVEQFFLAILREPTPQTILLFSDESMAWLYESETFAKRWKELFVNVIAKGNRVRVIHTVARDMNELFEAVSKWLPIYMTGAIESYYYPRLRDGVFQRTMYIAPATAAVISSSVQHNSEGMLNVFLTDKAALQSVTLEFERYLSMCQRLMSIYGAEQSREFQSAIDGLFAAQGNSVMQTDTLPLFAMPESLVEELSGQSENNTLLSVWKKSVHVFQRGVKNHTLYLMMANKGRRDGTQENPPRIQLSELMNIQSIYTEQQYDKHYERLLQLEKRYENLKLCESDQLLPGMLIYAKEDIGVMMARVDTPMTAFVIRERNMINAFMNYLTKQLR